MLGPEVFGVYALGTFWASLLAFRAKFGISFAALRQPATDGELFGSYFRLDIILSACSLGLSLVAAAILPYLGYPPEISAVVIVLAACEFFPALIGPYGLALKKELQLSRMSLVSLFSTLLASCIAVLLAYNGVGIWSLLIMSLVTTVVGLAGVYWVARRRLPQIFAPEMALQPSRGGSFWARGSRSAWRTRDKRSSSVNLTTS